MYWVEAAFLQNKRSSGCYYLDLLDNLATVCRLENDRVRGLESPSLSLYKDLVK